MQETLAWLTFVVDQSDHSADQRPTSRANLVTNSAVFRAVVRLAADSSAFYRMREPQLKCRCVCQRAEAVANRTCRQVDVHVPFKGALIEPREHLHRDLVERKRHLVREVSIYLEDHTHS